MVKKKKVKFINEQVIPRGTVFWVSLDKRKKE